MLQIGSYTDGSRDGLDLRLEAGLDFLSGLKRLEDFSFQGLWQQMEEQDVRWMMRVWKLRVIIGKLHHDNDRRLEMKPILSESHLKLNEVYPCDILSPHKGIFF